MIRGLYNAASGMDVQQAKFESVSNNLVNSTTPGYKREQLKVQSFPELLLIQQGGPQREKGPVPREPRLIGTMGTGTLVAGIVTDHTMGAVQQTGNPTDIVLKGPGFFTVSIAGEQAPGRIGYTRNGAFKIDQQGYLIESGGHRVLGEKGEIKLGDAGFQVEPDGTVKSGDLPVDRLRIVEFDDPGTLTKEGEGIFAGKEGEGRPAVSTSVSQGYLERSNVNVVEEMVELVKVIRTYEANQRLIQSHDEMLAKAVNQVGSLR